MYLSLKVPGSPSSALTTRYRGFGLAFGMNDHFFPVGKPAPPRPRRFGRETSSMTCAGVMEKSACLAASVASIGDVGVPPRPFSVPQPSREHRSVGGDEWLHGQGGSNLPFAPSAPPSASPSTASRVSFPFKGPMNCSSSCAIGAISHAHRHSTSVSVNSPSALSLQGQFQSLLQMREHRFCPAQHARQARADAKLAPAPGRRRRNIE